MKITCLSCKAFQFELEISENDFQETPIVSLTCPKCGKSTAVFQRPGGGLGVALDEAFEKKPS